MLWDWQPYPTLEGNTFTNYMNVWLQVSLFVCHWLLLSLVVRKRHLVFETGQTIIDADDSLTSLLSLSLSFSSDGFNQWFAWEFIPGSPLSLPSVCLSVSFSSHPCILHGNTRKCYSEYELKDRDEEKKERNRNFLSTFNDRVGGERKRCERQESKNIFLQWQRMGWRHQEKGEILWSLPGHFPTDSNRSLQGRMRKIQTDTPGSESEADAESMSSKTVLTSWFCSHPRIVAFHRQAYQPTSSLGLHWRVLKEPLYHWHQSIPWSWEACVKTTREGERDEN